MTLADWKWRRPKEARKVGKSTLADRYDAFCYRLMGKRLEANSDRSEKLAAQLRQANMSLTPSMFLARSYVTAMLVASISFLALTFVFYILLANPFWYLFALGLAGLGAGTVMMIFPLIMKSRISNMAGKLDQELPFTLSELSILASTGLSPVEIVRKIAKREESAAMAAEFRKAVHKLDIEGKDLITALSETARESPSAPFRETLWDLANMIHQGGDLDGYLRSKADDVMKAKRATQKEFIDKLSTYSDIYITLVLIGVLFIGIGAFMIDALGSSIMGLGSDTILLGLTFGIIPVSVAVIAVMVASAYSKVDG
jgi:flagellar protein FlaJ